MLSFKDILANKIADSLLPNRKGKANPMNADIKNQLIDLTNKGLLIDFSSVYRDDTCVGINFYTIGLFEDMDQMYNNLEQYKLQANIKGKIEFRNDIWIVFYL